MNKLIIIMTIVATTSTLACNSCSKDRNEITGNSDVENDDSRVFTIGNATFKMIYVEKGTFAMGSNNTDVQFRPTRKTQADRTMSNVAAVTITDFQQNLIFSLLLADISMVVPTGP